MGTLHITADVIAVKKTGEITEIALVQPQDLPDSIKQLIGTAAVGTCRVLYNHDHEGLGCVSSTCNGSCTLHDFYENGTKYYWCSCDPT